MAEETTGPSWRYGCVAWAGVALVVCAILFVGIAIDQWDFDRRVCAPGESGECIATGTGVIASDDISFEDVRVAYDDGTKTADVYLDSDDEPAPGTRVVLEWWDGDVVALVERDSGRRYETGDWPYPWWEWLAFWGVLAVMAGIALAAVFGVVAGVQRLLRRGRAARSSGQP